MGSQFSLFVTENDERSLARSLMQISDLVSVYYKDGIGVVSSAVLIHNSTRPPDRRLILSRNDFLKQIEVQSVITQSGYVENYIQTRTSPVIEYDISALDEKYIIPGRMYYNGFYLTGSIEKEFRLFGKEVFRIAKGNLIKVKNLFGSTIYLGEEMYSLYQAGNYDFRLI